jgi:serine/threonine protein kinase/polyhydroxyalkanoate synthesis regulator phasin
MMTSMQAESPLADRYVLVRRLASGGMGEVWLARDAVLGREVAVKVIAVGSDGDPLAVERFRREATMTAALEHPNIVTIFDSGTHHGSAFIVMELLAGPTLAQFVADRGPLPEPEAVRLGAQIAAGLAAAHRAGVVHRDIKPSNLMFSSSGMLKILDFGIARLSQTTAPALTTANAVIGSAPYLSPEQAVGAPADERSDLYSLGCVLVTMVTGRPPFMGEHPMAVLQQHVSADPPLLRDRQPGVSSALEALVGQLLSKRADARPASADEVEERLTRIMAARDGAGLAATAVLVATGGPMETRTIAQAATRPYPTASWPTEIADPRPREVRPAGSAQPRPRSWWLIAAVLLAGVVLAAAVLTPLLSRSGGVASGPSAPGTPSILTTPSAPATSASPKTTPQASATGQPISPLANVRAVVNTLVAEGQMDPKRAKEFGRLLDDLAKTPDKKGHKKDDDSKGTGKQVDDLSKYLGQLVKSGELTPEGFRRIEAALASV